MGFHQEGDLLNNDALVCINELLNGDQKQTSN